MQGVLSQVLSWFGRRTLAYSTSILIQSGLYFCCEPLGFMKLPCGHECRAMALLSGAEDALAKDVEFQCDVRLALPECVLTLMDLPPDPGEEARLPERRISWLDR